VHGNAPYAIPRRGASAGISPFSTFDVDTAAVVVDTAAVDDTAGVMVVVTTIVVAIAVVLGVAS